MTNDPNEWQGRGMEPTTIVDLVAGGRGETLPSPP